MFEALKKMVSNKVAELSDATLHEDVYSAQDLLLNEANKILNEPARYDKERLEILEKLSSLGFSNAEQVKEFRDIQRERKKCEYLKGVIERYQQKYPNNKFINEDAVTIICEKYNLYLCMAKDYIGEIPENNQKEIVNFKFNEVDYRTPDQLYSFNEYSYTEIYRSMMKPQSENKHREWIPATNVLIVAPEKKINMKGKEKKGHKIVLKDPIVLQPVKGGYLIVSSWGMEASDPIVLNPKHN